MKFLLFDREENYIGNLKDVLEAKQTEEINGEDVLELAVLEQKIENISDEWGRNYVQNSSEERELNNEWQGIPLYVDTIGEFIDETVTVSFEARLHEDDMSNGIIRVYFRGGSGTVYFSPDVTITGEWVRYSRTMHITESVANSGNNQIAFHFGANSVHGYVRNVKLEKGSVATPWTPAPEDLDIKPQDTIEKGYKIAYKTEYGHWKEFAVKEIEEAHLTDGIEKRIYCESSFYETIGDYIEDKRPSGTANHALSVALEPTRWEVGIVDNLGTNTTSLYQISAKEAVQKVAETWKGEIRTRVEVVGNKIVHRYVDILERRGGDYGKRFTYTKDLESVTKTVHRDDVITALYGYGKGEEVGEGHGRRIDFASINDGKAYVENLDALAIWGRPNGDGTKSHVYGKVEFDDCEDKQELLQLTAEKLEEVSSPLITYEAKAIDLGGADLGDDVAVIDTEFTPELRLKARVIKIVRDLLKEENNNLVLGNFIPSIIDSWNKQEEFINNFRSKQGVWDRADIINNDGTINAQFLNNLVDELNQKMNSQGGYVYVSEDGKGLITYDKPIDQDPTMAIQILGGAFRIANSKLPNGEFDWRTFGTGAGFTADEFVAGVLRGGKVHFDLTNGTFLIGDSIEDYIFYFDGTTLKVRLGTGKTVEESLQEIQDYADTKASQAETTAKAYAELKAKEEVDSLEIGGRNLLRNSDFSDGLTNWVNQGYSLSVVDGVLIAKNVSGTGTRFYYDIIRMPIGETYTISFEAKADKDNSEIFLGQGGSSPNIGTISLTTAWKRYDITFQSVNDYTISFHLSEPDVDYYFTNIKLEKGNKPTDWTPAPEDVDEAISTVDTKYSNKVAEIDTTIDGITQRVESTETVVSTINDEVVSLESRVNSAEQKIAPTAIVQTVRQSTGYQNDLDGKVSKNNIISEINQSAEEVQINANRVKIGMGTTFEQGQIYTWEQYAGKTWNQMNS